MWSLLFPLANRDYYAGVINCTLKAVGLARPIPTQSPTPTSNPLSYYEKGHEYFDAANYPIAINQFTLAIQGGPYLSVGTLSNSRLSKAYFWRGVSYYQLDEAQKALQDVDFAIQLSGKGPNPENSTLYCVRGDIYWELHKYMEYQADHEKGNLIYLSHNPSEPLTYETYRDALFWLTHSWD